MKKIICRGESNGYSMRPIINQGDTLYVAKINKNDLSQGDIIVFYQGKKLVGHRLIWIIKDKYVTKGDNNIFFDKPLDYGQILGRVNKIEGKCGRLNLESTRAKIIQKYFVFFTLVTYYPPRLLGKILSFIFKERGFLIKLLKEKHLTK